MIPKIIEILADKKYTYTRVLCESWEAMTKRVEKEGNWSRFIVYELEKVSPLKATGESPYHPYGLNKKAGNLAEKALGGSGQRSTDTPKVAREGKNAPGDVK